MPDRSKEFHSALGMQPASMYARINYDQEFVLLSMRDKDSNDALYMFTFDEFKDLCQVFEILKGHLLET
jgi:hypothetical protein